MDVGGLRASAKSGSLVVLDAGATANRICFSWLGCHKRIIQKKGLPRVSTYPASARFRFGNGRLGEVRHVADIPVGIPGSMRQFAACALGADIPAFLRRGASGALGGQLDVSRDILTLRKQGVDIPPRVNQMGRDKCGRRGLRNGKLTEK